MMSSGPHPSVPLTQAQIAQQQQAQAHASELAKRRSRKPTDKNLPDGVEDSIVDPEGVQRYRDLRDVERRLDSTMTRKRLDVVDSATRNTKVGIHALADPSALLTCHVQSYRRRFASGSATLLKTKSGKETA